MKMAAGLASIPFVGKYSSSGRIESGAFKPFKYYQSWKGKKKEKVDPLV